MQYNQAEVAQAVRIGNWQEELRLKQETGIRFYPEPTVRENSLLSKTRCIVHTEQTLPKDYISVTRDTIRDPKTNPAAVKIETMGPRMKRFESQVKTKIDSDLKMQATFDFHESRKLTYSTAFKDDHCLANFQPTLKENNPFIRVPTKTTSYSTDEPVTIYSHAVRDTDHENVNFPLSFIGSMNPFRKNLVFSADIQNDVLMTRTETYERPKPLPTVREYKGLLTFREKILTEIRKNLQTQSMNTFTGSAVRYLIRELSKNIKNETVPIQQLETVLFDITGRNQPPVTYAERCALLAAYDLRNNDHISMFDFCGLFRRTPVMRRMELINLYYESLDSTAEGKVDISVVRNRVFAGRKEGRAFLEYVGDLGGMVMTMEDFYEFYIDASSEMENDDVFEEMMRATWGDV